MRQLKRLLLSNIHLCRIGTPFYESQKFPKEHANGNGNFRMGRYYFVARKNSATSYFIRKRIFPIEYYLKISRKVIKPT